MNTDNNISILKLTMGYFIDIIICFVYNILFYLFIIKSHFPSSNIENFLFWFFYISPFHFNIVISYPLILFIGTRPGLFIMKVRLVNASKIKLFFSNIIYSFIIALIFAGWFEEASFGSIVLLIGIIFAGFYKIIIWDKIFNINYQSYINLGS